MEKKALTEEYVLLVRGLCRRSFESNNELSNDCFLYVFEKLKDDDSRRIKAFRGKASFRTFLYSVTSKLIIDFRRRQFGYKVLPKYYWEFDEINRHIFKLFFYQRLTPGWAENAVKAEFKISEEEAQRRVDNVDKRMRESRLKRDTRNLEQEVHIEEIETLASDDIRSDPEEIMISKEAGKMKENVLKILKEEVQKLDDEDSLILQLYFEQGLTAKQVTGAIPGIKEKKVYKRVEKILTKIRKNIQERGVSQEDISDIFERLT